MTPFFWYPLMVSPLRTAWPTFDEVVTHAIPTWMPTPPWQPKLEEPTGTPGGREDRVREIYRGAAGHHGAVLAVVAGAGGPRPGDGDPGHLHRDMPAHHDTIWSGDSGPVPGAVSHDVVESATLAGRAAVTTP